MKKIAILIVVMFVANSFASVQMKTAEVKDSGKNSVFCTVLDNTSTPVNLISEGNDPKTKKNEDPKKNTTNKEKVNTKEGCGMDKVKTKEGCGTDKVKTKEGCGTNKEKTKEGCGGCTGHEME